MLTRLSYYADKVIELGWLAVAVSAPLFFNVYSSRVFEPDKIAVIRSIVVIMMVAWLIKLFEGGYAAYTQQPGGNGNKAGAALREAAERGLPAWLGFLRVPMVVPILVYALAFLISSIFTVTPDATIYGSYQRLQGTYTQYSYMMLAFLLVANLRTRAQFERLINFMLLTSLPVALYGVAQAMRIDPLPWAGDTSSRVASTMGNAIFVAAWLIMVVPFTIYRFFVGISGAWAARNAAPGPQAQEPERARTQAQRASRASRKLDVSYEPDQSWAVVTNCFGVLLIQLFVFYLALKIMAGLPFPDGRMWPAIFVALAIFYVGCWLIEWLGKHRTDPAQVRTYLPAIVAGVFLSAVLAFMFDWSINRGDGTSVQSLTAQVGIDGAAFLWVLFFTLLMASVGSAAYAISIGGRRTEHKPERDVARLALNVGYVILFFFLLLCIYLTQSRGPWLGLGAGLVVFAVGMWLVGRDKGVRWMARIGGITSAAVLALVLFVGLLNIPSSPLQALSSLPVLGRGIERLSTLTTTDTGTGLVRELIWKGATQLIVSDPARALIGWGPEAMYVAYNPFYPPELAQHELRNATPDRSHNVEFDQLVTMGALGLLAYYFLVIAFFFFAIKALKRASNTRDQLILIALISAVTSHFIEIQTGIQIAATWSYFYLFIGMLVAFAYFITPYLRADVVVERTESPAGVNAGIPPTRELTPAAVSAPAVQATVKLKTGNGRAQAQGGLSGNRARGSGPTSGQGRDGKSQPDGRRYRASAPAQTARRSAGASWYKSPAMLVAYVIVAVLGLLVIWNVNAATVHADMLYKEGQAYDNAQRWPEAISLYQQAIQLQPNQDYYYLFLGRSWLEFAKQVDQEQFNVRAYYESGLTQQTPYKDPNQKDASKAARDEQAARQAEKLLRLQQSEQWLMQAHNLSPLNSDHYANLGRLYLYWADPTGGNDPSKAPLAIQFMKGATERTPGNAQLQDELAVAYAHGGQFDKGIQTLLYSQRNVDPTYANTPYLRAELYMERAQTVKADLVGGQPLPTDGETDYGKLAISAAQAYSETIGLDPTQFVSADFKSRIDFLASAAQPFTNTNSAVAPKELQNVLTSTVMAALETQLPRREKNIADYLRSRGAYSGDANSVPDSVLKSLWNDPSWAASDGSSKVWLDTSLSNAVNPAVDSYQVLGYIYTKTSQVSRALDSYQRALALDPGNTAVQQDLQALQSGKSP